MTNENVSNNEPAKESKRQGAGKEAKDTKSSATSETKSIFPPLSRYAPPETSKDPLRILQEIAGDKDIDTEAKTWLFNYAVTRFKNRRKMAYLSLIAILASLVFLILGAVHDGLSKCVIDKSCVGILTSLSEVEGLFVWIEGFLAAIVATYYGVSSFRPSS